MHHDGTSLFIAFFDVAINLKMKVFFILYVIILLISMTISRILFFTKQQISNIVGTYFFSL